MASPPNYAPSDVDIKKDGEAQELEQVYSDTGETLSPEEDRRILRKLDMKYIAS